MLTTKTNIHHSKLPRVGEIGYLILKYDLIGSPIYLECKYGRRYAGDRVKGTIGDKVIVESFPVCDNVLPYSKGIHTANFRVLRTGKIVRYSGFYFQSQEQFTTRGQDD